MKLNPDCVRDILIFVEENTDFETSVDYSSDDIPDTLNSYEHEEIVYHIRQCDMSSLITGVHYYDGGNSISILDLTPAGHDFLANIRSDNLWNTTKEVSSEIGTKSLSALTQIATAVITSLINHKLGF